MIKASSDLEGFMTLRADDGTEFRWHGGEYIDVGYTQAQGVPGIDGDDFHAYDVINVWDYEADKPRIARTLGAFEVAVREWLRDQQERKDGQS